MNNSENAARTERSPNASEARHKAHEEYQYLALIRHILAEGEHRPDRYAEPPSAER